MEGHARHGGGTATLCWLGRRLVLFQLALLAGCVVISERPASRPPLAPSWRGQALGVACKDHLQSWRRRDFDALVTLGANALSFTPFASMPDPGAPEVRRSHIQEHQREVLRKAREAGLFVLLKPHLWIDQSWHGAVEMRAAEDWPAFFAAYRAFLLDWAEVAREEAVAALCIGTELDRTLGHEDEWRALIRAVRAVYPGKLFYTAHWSDYARVPFWDALDAIGISAYFPLDVGPRPSHAELVAAWQPIRCELARFSAAAGRPIVFAELGYRPLAGVFARPWAHAAGRELAPENQANGLDAALAVFLDEPWFGGVFVWEWFDARFVARRWHGGSSYSPQGTAAEQRLGARFRAAQRRAPR
jgi:hypothetical protein